MLSENVDNLKKDYQKHAEKRNSFLRVICEKMAPRRTMAQG